MGEDEVMERERGGGAALVLSAETCFWHTHPTLSLINISEPTRQAEISYAVFCLKKKMSFTFYFFTLLLLHTSLSSIPYLLTSSIY